MNNSQQSLFFLAIGEATYSEIDCLNNLFQCVESPVEYWSLMQPDHLRQIIRNAEQRLLKICLQCMTEKFDGLASTDSEFSSSELKPSFYMMSKVKQFIDGDIDVIGKEVGQYEYSYQLFINSRQKYENCLIQLNVSQTNLASIAVSPATSVNSVNSFASLNLAQQDFEKQNQQLRRHFAEILQKTATYLDGMQERTFQAISRYIDQLESHQFWV